MYKIPLVNGIQRTYTNNGQHAEQIFRYTLTGQICKADNTPSWVSGDCNDIQVKSARATICKGTNIAAHIEADAAKAYAYVTADFITAYIMTPVEWLTFTTTFGTVTRESQKNGGAEKTRLGKESKAMIEWLKQNAA